MKSNDSVIVSWDLSNERDKSILLVGRVENGVTKIINAFQGEEAVNILDKLLYGCPWQFTQNPNVKKI